jgi:hypothetical protein
MSHRYCCDRSACDVTRESQCYAHGECSAECSATAPAPIFLLRVAQAFLQRFAFSNAVAGAHALAQPHDRFVQLFALLTMPARLSGLTRWCPRNFCTRRRTRHWRGRRRGRRRERRRRCIYIESACPHIDALGIATAGSIRVYGCAAQTAAVHDGRVCPGSIRGGTRDEQDTRQNSAPAPHAFIPCARPMTRPMIGAVADRQKRA